METAESENEGTRGGQTDDDNATATAAAECGVRQLDVIGRGGESPKRQQNRARGGVGRASSDGKVLTAHDTIRYDQMDGLVCG